MANTGKNLTEGNLVKNIFLFAVPIIATSILQLLFNAADMIVVGRFSGDVALAAVGSTGALINLVVNLLMGLSVGAAVGASQYFGAGDEDGVSRVTHTAIIVSVTGGILVGIVGVAGARVFLGWMGSPGDVIGSATLYLRIYFCGIPVMMVYNFGASILRSVGDTKHPLIFLASSGVLNVILNLFFVIVLRMSVAGVATATLISQSLAAFLVVRFMVRSDGGVVLRRERLRIDRRELVKMLRIGIPAGLQGTVFSLSNVVIQSSVNSFGSLVMAGNSAAANLEGFVWVGMNAYHQSAMTVVGQHVGAGKYKKIHSVMLNCLWMVSLTGMGLSAAVLLFRYPLLGLYCTEDPAAIEYGIIRFRWVCATYFTCGIMDMFTGCIRGMGNSLAPMIISLLGACGSRILWVATYFRTHHTLNALYACYPISWVLTALALLICYIIVYRRLITRVARFR